MGMYHLADEVKARALLAYENFSAELQSKPEFRAIAGMPHALEVMELFKTGFLAGYAAATNGGVRA